MMVKTNAELQRAYRQRHLHDVDGNSERLDTLITITSKQALQRMASHLGATQRTVLESLIAKAEADLLVSLGAKGQRQYYEDKPIKKITG